MIFNQIVGHEKTVARLKKILDLKPLTNRALLFCGPSGVGKKLTALGWAQGILCQEAKSPCGKCGPCLRVAAKTHPDLLLVEPAESQSLKTDQIKDVLRFVSMRAFEGQAKVVIIDECQSMTSQAANSLLKTLEEPPEKTHFVLVTSNRGAVLPTIQSRTQPMLFGSLNRSELSKILPQAEPWVFDLTQGRVDLALKFSDEGYKKWRGQATKILRGLENFRLFEGFTNIADLSREKESALFTVHCWSQIFKIASYELLTGKKSGTVDAASADDLSTVECVKKIFSTNALLNIGQKLFRLEQDILANVNKGLAFEQFFIEAQAARKGARP